jgi:hypothetical protein
MNSWRRHLGLGFALATGVGFAVLLCVQCIRTYVYVGKVLVPQEAEREADRQAGMLVTAARTDAVTYPGELGPQLESIVEADPERVLWMRLLDRDSGILAQAGKPESEPKVPPRWWEQVEQRENIGRVIDTPEGKAYVTILSFRMPRVQRGGAEEAQGIEGRGRGRGIAGGRRSAYALEVALRLDGVAEAFRGLTENLIFGLCASVALLAAMIVMGVRAPVHLRGEYLEREMQLARRVQGDLLPKAVSVSPHIEFAAEAVAADHVGGDFYDLFETESGKVTILLGDVSGKGIPAALLASVVQGAVRSSGATQHETACERINGMLCERSASGQYATVFWAVFDPFTATLRYVNAGHAAPVLFKKSGGPAEKLSEGGPVLGLLPKATYAARTVQVETGDTLVVYSDGVSEAANSKQEEFGDDRIFSIGESSSERTPSEICQQIMTQVEAFSQSGAASDDRTLLVIRFLRSKAAMTA